MRLKTYPLEANESLMTFEFTSEGPKGFIRKRVQFQRMNRKNMYNLAFGDVNIVTYDFDDKVAILFRKVAAFSPVLKLKTSEKIFFLPILKFKSSKNKL